ncbi:MAG: hypothetical protein NE330_23885 [Lentisphaeraceae bacterium]|nr:hypothetical protein [Lentisphaeraceae bacterium]
MSFSRSIQIWANKSGQNIEKIRRAVILELFTSVILDTPVDEGRLRGNWIISSDKPSDEVIDLLDPSGNKSTQNVHSFVTSLKAGDQKVYLSNNLPYAYRIEFGYSREKAPAGMVRKNFMRISDNLQRKLK